MVKHGGLMDSPFFFTKKQWHLLKEYLMTMLQNFYRNGIINNNVNNTYIALIGKKKDRCLSPSNYRPINLTTSLYKIIAKTLTNRLKITLPNTVTEDQMAFIKGRQ